MQAVQSLGSDEVKPIATVAPALSNPALRILSETLQYPALLGYLKERGIDPAIAAEHFRKVCYAVGDKTYFAIGFATIPKDGNYVPNGSKAVVRLKTSRPSTTAAARSWCSRGLWTSFLISH